MFGRGIGWPGWRLALPGETPDWENLVIDTSLPEYALRTDAVAQPTRRGDPHREA